MLHFVSLKVFVYKFFLSIFYFSDLAPVWPDRKVGHQITVGPSGHHNPNGHQTSSTNSHPTGSSGHQTGATGHHAGSADYQIIPKGHQSGPTGHQTGPNVHQNSPKSHHGGHNVPNSTNIQHKGASSSWHNGK